MLLLNNKGDDTTALFPKQLQYNFNGSNTDGSFTPAVSNSFLSPLAANLGQLGVIFFFILKMVYCVHTLESPHNIPSC